MALNSKYLDKTGNNIFVLMGDGEAAAGSVWEAAEIASYYKLNNLIGILDVNGLGQSQPTMHGHDTEGFKRRFEAYGWRAIAIDGHDMRRILSALDEAMSPSEQPTMIGAATKKGKGGPFVGDNKGWHGKGFKKGREEDPA